MGVSLFSHWLSEAFAGALMGYAIGKSVGGSFNQLLNDDNGKKVNYSLYPVPNGIGIRIDF